MLLTDETPLYTRGWSNVLWNPWLAKALTFFGKYPKHGTTDLPSIEVFRRLDDRMLVPVRAAPISGTDQRTFYEGQEVGEVKCPPRENQLQLIAQSAALLTEGQNHIFEAPTGFGKSYCGAAVARLINQPTIIIVTKQDLMDSWHRTLTTLIGVPPKDIGIAQADKLNYHGKKFVLAMVHSLARPEKYDDNFFRYFGMAIFDEIHRMGAPYFNPVCGRLWAKYKLGLSATPTRQDKLDPVFQYHIGPVMVKATVVPMKPKVLVKHTGWKLPEKAHKTPDGEFEMKPIKATPGQMAHVLKIMAASPKRNAVIAEFVKQAYAAGRTTLILSDLVDGHLKRLFHIFHEAGIPGEDMGFYTGEQSKSELEATKKKRVALATYGMCGEGTDVPQWDTLVMATPRANVKQPLGRILRSMEGKKQPVCLDLVDWNGVFTSFFRRREATYYSVGAEIVRMK